MRELCARLCMYVMICESLFIYILGACARDFVCVSLRMGLCVCIYVYVSCVCLRLCMFA